MTNKYYSKYSAAGQTEAFIAESLTNIPDPEIPGDGPGTFSGAVRQIRTRLRQDSKAAPYVTHRLSHSASVLEHDRRLRK